MTGFAAVTGGQVEIDVRPGIATLGKKAFEQQLLLDGIDGGDAEAVADGGVGCRAAALNENALVAGEIDDLADDEKVAAEAEPSDQAEFVVELPADLFG